MTQKNNDYKIILIGDSAVGKTSIFKKISSGTFTDRNISTIGMDKRTLNFKDIEVEIEGKKHIEEFNIILYDITNRKSFDDVGSWLESLSDILSSWKTAKYSIILFGNKLDVVESGEKQREVEEDEADKLCEDKSIKWGGEISVKESSVEDLNEILLKAWRDYVQKFGLKTEISSQNRMEGAKWVRKKKKKGFC